MEQEQQRSAAELPADVTRFVDDFVKAARTSLGADLESIVLFGTAADGRLRALSDVNVLVVVRQWTQAAADALRQPTRVAGAAVRLSPMFVLASEFGDCAVAFADKFSDMLRRHRVVFGSDPFVHLAIPRPALIARERQALLNLIVRMRRLYLEASPREEQAQRVLSDLAGPLRASAATLLQLEGGEAKAPREAFEAVVARWPDLGGVAAARTTSAVRQQESIEPGAAALALFALIGVAERIRAAYGELVV